MGKIAFVFSGQGDQYTGMGQELARNYPAAAEVFQICDALRPGTSKQCFEGTEEVLSETINTQPCLFAVELAAAAVLREKGIVPDAVAGFSLGEVSAAAFAGVFDLKTGFQLVCRRAELMQKAAEEHDTAMAAVVRLAPEQVRELCAQFEEVYPVNFNCPGQISVSGRRDQMPEFSKAVRAAGGRALPLKVKGAFHSPFMEGAARAFGEVLRGVSMEEGTILLYSNVTAEPYTEHRAELLSRQICSPVQWETLIRNLCAAGITTFIEIGPGKTLSNMIRKIDAGAEVYSTAELSALLEKVTGC